MCKGASVSDKDIFEAIDQIHSKKKQRPDIRSIFNYLKKMEKNGNASLSCLSKRIMNMEKEGKIVNRMFNGKDSFYVAESDIQDTMPSRSGPQIQSTVLTPLHSYDEANSYESNKLKDLPTEMAALKSFVLEHLLYNKIKCEVEL